MASGKLAVTVFSGRNLKGYDFLSKIDPYVILRLGSSTQKSSVKKNAGANPTWNETFHFDIPYGVQNFLTISVYDHDTLSRDDFIGEVMIDCSQLMDRTADAWYDVRQKNGHSGGSIHLRLSVQAPGYAAYGAPHEYGMPAGYPPQAPAGCPMQAPAPATYHAAAGVAPAVAHGPPPKHQKHNGEGAGVPGMLVGGYLGNKVGGKVGMVAGALLGKNWGKH